MNYHQYYPVDIVNGPGTRCTLFVSGCVHECPGCYNKSTWRLNSGQPFSKEMEDKIIADLNDTRIHRQGISLSGGDPLHPQNVPDILQLVQRIRAECPGKTSGCGPATSSMNSTPRKCRLSISSTCWLTVNMCRISKTRR